MDVKALIFTKVTGTLPNFTCRPESWTHLQTIILADPESHIPSQVDLLLGADVYAELLRAGRRCGPIGTPIAQESALGWLLSGRIETNPQATEINVHLTHLDLNASVQRFWELEEVPTIKPMTAEEKLCEEHFSATHRRDCNGRFFVRLPTKKPILPMHGTRDVAVRRLKQTERGIFHHPEKRKKYENFMQEYEDLHHMECVPKNEIPAVNAVYMPHHAVTREASSTTKLRVVFDASAKCRNGTSLNEHLMVGPTLQDDLFSILIRFRTHLIAITADISKMYRQIRVDQEDADYQRIVWRKSIDKPIIDYRLLTVTYGTAAAPYLATKCLQQLAVDEATTFPRASEITLRDFYVDDLMSGTDTIDEALNLQTELIELLSRGGFELRKWSSNASALLEALPPSFRETQVPLHIDMDESVKTLGLRWNPATDHFSFCLAPNDSTTVITKRKLLSDLAKVFDPLGWLSPTTVKAKILFQRLWRTSCDWDDNLPADIEHEWINYLQELRSIESIKITRCLFPEKGSNHQLHGFCDSSEEAYGAAVYLRSTSQSGEVSVTLISGKTRVAPIKPVTLPRLELWRSLISQINCFLYRVH